MSEGMPVSERSSAQDYPEGLCPVCGMWQSDAETNPEERARINARFAGVKSGQLANAKAEVERLRAELGDAVDQARLFNRGGLTWLEYDRLLVRWEAIADAQG